MTPLDLNPLNTPEARGFDAASTSFNDFDDTMDMLFHTPSTTETPPDITTDESISLHSHTSNMFDITDLMQPSLMVPDLDLSGFVFSDSSPVPKPVLPMAPVTWSTQGLDYLDNNSQAYVARTEFPWAV